MIYRIKISDHETMPDVYFQEKYVDADNQLSALQILAKDICAAEFRKHPNLEKVIAFGGNEKITIEPLCESILK